MKLGDLLNAVGASTLDSPHYTWAVNVLAVINNVLPTARALTVANTATDVLTAINALSVEDHVKLLTMEVDPMTGAVTAGTVPTAPATGSVVPPRNPRQVMALFIGGVMVFLALLMGAMSTVQQVKSGQPTDTKPMEQIFQVLLDVLKAFLSNGSN